MLANVTSLTGNGLKDWLLQRISAIYIFIYIIFATGWFWHFMPFNYVKWVLFIHNPFMQISTILMLFLLTLHAWIGLWTVTTDYIKCTILRISTQSIIGLFLLGQLIFGLNIIWG